MKIQALTRRGYELASRAVCLIILLVFLPSIAFAWSGECVAVKDGDSIFVMNKGTREEIRLQGIDCPEWGQPFCGRAKKFTNQMVRGKIVEVEPVTTDRYGRTVALVTVDGKSLNKELVRVGLAWWYQKYAPNDSELERLEKEAREAKRGLWVLPNPKPPWVDRAEKRKAASR
ncbi:MAG: thermonuclease family protein [Deltaproteobacteria bacterium]|nr:thermonuclease family protein [Deltaproteobacteria bacterium]